MPRAAHPRAQVAASRRQSTRWRHPVVRRPHPDGRRLLHRLRVLLAGLALLAAGVLLIWVWTTPALRLRHVRIAGTTDPAVVNAVRALPLTGCFVMRCDLARDTAQVERLPAVAHAEVSIVAPDTLLVRVTLRRPVLIWRARDSAFLVAGDGVLIRPASAGAPGRLPLVEDPGAAALGGAVPRPGARLPSVLVEMATQLRSGLPSVMGAGVVLSYDSGAGLVASDGQGLRVAFGDPSRPPGAVAGGAQGQLSRLRAILGILAQRGQRAVWIDLRWGMDPSYRLSGS